MVNEAMDCQRSDFYRMRAFGIVTNVLRPYAFMLLLVGISQTSHAEGGCPPDQYPQQSQGWQTCVPIPGYAQSRTQRLPQTVWIDEYGAVATDAQAGVLGASTDSPTRDIAKATALDKCRAAGGTDCKMQVSYGNSCVAIALGDQSFVIRTGSTA